jgi:L-aspartate oxidase
MEMRATGDDSAFLDLTHLPRGFVRERFPRIYETCLRHGVDLERVPAPVRPAAHYAMGGIKTNLNGQTTLPRLCAAGEAACTGVHGANRLASNSLLEAVVFGARAGRAMQQLPPVRERLDDSVPQAFPTGTELELRRLMWNACGILRSGPEVQAAWKKLRQQNLESRETATRAQHELRNMHQVSILLTQAALAREESRGGHYRIDFPVKSPAFQKHSVLTKRTEDRTRVDDAELAFL